MSTNICNSCIHRRVCEMRNNEKPTVKVCIERVEDNGQHAISGWHIIKQDVQV